MPPARIAFMIVISASLHGCGTVPQVGGTRAEAARAAPYPALVNLETLIASAQTATPRITPASIGGMRNRTTALRARAARLRGPVVDAATKSQMRAASTRAALR